MADVAVVESRRMEERKVHSRKRSSRSSSREGSRLLVFAFVVSRAPFCISQSAIDGKRGGKSEGGSPLCPSWSAIMNFMNGDSDFPKIREFSDMHANYRLKMLLPTQTVSFPLFASILGQIVQLVPEHEVAEREDKFGAVGDDRSSSLLIFSSDRRASFCASICSMSRTSTLLQACKKKQSPSCILMFSRKKIK